MCKAVVCALCGVQAASHVLVRAPDLSVFCRTVIHANFVSSDGSSNWLLGLQLVGTYVLISLLCAVSPHLLISIRQGAPAICRCCRRVPPAFVLRAWPRSDSKQTGCQKMPTELLRLAHCRYFFRSS